MIPENVAEFIHGPVFLSIGTRDARLRPTHAWVCGAVVHPDRETVSCFVQQEAAARALVHLEENGRVALNAGSPTHEAYQLKGRYVSSRPADANDRSVQEVYRSELLPFMLRCAYPEPVARPLVLTLRYQPATAITFRVEDVFVQTPGPDAGKKIG